MEDEAVIDKTAKHVEEVLTDEYSGHDWWHTYRVWKMASRLAESEQCDAVVVQLAALLHDIADWKFHGGDESVGPAVAQAWLRHVGQGEDRITKVCGIIRSIAFRGARVPDAVDCIEASIVQDADRLDAIGAIGIARTFAFGGNQGRIIHNPNSQPSLHTSAAEYKGNRSSTINHFHEKLLLLKDRMNTNMARRIATERHEFMLLFLERFSAEWEGDL